MYFTMRLFDPKFCQDKFPGVYMHNVTITHIYAVFYIGNQDLNLFFYEYLEKIKIYTFVLENYLQMIYPSFLCMMTNF
jgi:hypothetical protein